MRVQTRLQLGALLPIALAIVVCLIVAGFLLYVLQPGIQQPATAVVLVFIAMVGLISCGASYNVADRVTRRLNELEQAASKVQEGNLKQIEEVAGSDEFSHICDVFNQMIAELKDYVQLLPAHSKVVRQFEQAQQTVELLRSSNVEVSDGLERLQRAEDQVIPHDRARTLFHMFGGIARHLNDGLMAILGTLELELAREDGTCNPARQSLETIRAVANELNEQTQRFLEYYRLPESGTEKIALDELVAEAIRLTEPKWRDEPESDGAGIVVENKCAPDTWVTANRLDMIQVLTNLIFNAVEAMPRGGTLTIDSRASSDGNTILSITDSGVGMPAGLVARCMKPFFSSKPDAAGLGLTVAAGILSRYGGKLGVLSETGEGATVLVELPAPREETSDPNTVSPSCQPAPVPRKILVVDDSQWVAEIVARGLECDGHVVDVGFNGREGLEKFEAGSYDLVITDRAMPEMGGIELAAAVKKANRSTPVVLMTGFGDTMLAKSQRPPNIDVVIGKPVSLDALRAMLPTPAGAN